MMRKWVAVCLAMLLMIPAMAMAEVRTVSTPEELIAAIEYADKNAVTIEITADIDMTGHTWPEKMIANDELIIDGQGHTLKGMTKALIAETWICPKLEIKNLTIADSDIGHSNTNANQNGYGGLGAFIGYTSASQNVLLENCHVKDSTINGASWVGGLVGYAAGYSRQNDGPVFQNLTMKNCSVINVKINSEGAAGGVIGHAMGDPWTKVDILNCTVQGNEIHSTDPKKDGDYKVGSLVGTVGNGGNEVSGKTGGVTLDVEESDNKVTTATQSGSVIEIESPFGRFSSTNSVIQIVGGSYDIGTKMLTQQGTEGTFQIKNGSFSNPPASNYVAAGAAAVSETGGDYHVGQAAVEAFNDLEPGTELVIESLGNDSAVTAQIAKQLEKVPAGVTVKNETGKEIVVNGETVKPDEEIKIMQAYKVVEGAKQSVTQGTLPVFKINVDLEKHEDTLVDGKLLVLNRDYVRRSGSTIIELSASFVDTLAVGEHTMDVVFTDGVASTTFTIEAVSVAEMPETGDNSNLMLYAALVLLCTAGIVMMKRRAMN